jgi:hypothetical protein
MLRAGYLAPTSKLHKEFGPRAKSRQFCMQTRLPDEGVLGTAAERE